MLYILCRLQKKLDERCGEAEVFNNYLAKLSSRQQSFVSMILRNYHREKEGRRYTDDERLLCLSIFKRSAATYRYLCTFLPLPAPRRLRYILRNIELGCGFTTTMKNCLREICNRISDPQEKVCIFMWDEVSLQPQVQYCQKDDKIVGLEDWSSKRTSQYADKALVFMLRGIKSGWKIPLSYYYSQYQTKTPQLTTCIRENHNEATKAGFLIVATVCDQGSSNMGAIKLLQQETNKIREEKDILKCKCDSRITN